MTRKISKRPSNGPRTTGLRLEVVIEKVATSYVVATSISCGRQPPELLQPAPVCERTPSGRSPRTAGVPC